MPDHSLMPTSLATPAYWQGTSDTFDEGGLVTTSAGNRWNVPGEPTIYLAGDFGMALVEAGRHAAPSDALERRVIWRLWVQLRSVMDLREAAVRRALELESPTWFLDRARCRGVVARLRADRACEAIRVPSAGAADTPERWNLVLFVDLLDAPQGEVISQPEVAGVIAPWPLPGASGGAGQRPPPPASEDRPDVDPAPAST